MKGDEVRLVEAAQCGDAPALDELLTRYRGKVTSMVRSILGNSHDADDACQEVLLTISTNLSSLQNSQQFRSWVFGIAYRKAKDVQRKQAREQNARGNMPGPSMRLAETDRTELNLTIHGVMTHLPEDQRIALNLRYHGGASYAEIAEAMGVSLPTVRGVIYRGMKSLREALKESFENQGS